MGKWNGIGVILGCFSDIPLRISSIISSICRADYDEVWMSLAGWFILVPGLCYAAAACAYAWQGNWSLVIVYSGYSFSNSGLFWLDRIMAK